MVAKWLIKKISKYLYVVIECHAPWKVAKEEGNNDFRQKDKRQFLEMA